MEINISQSELENLTRLAQAAGFADAESYLTEHARSLSQQQIPDVILPHDEAELDGSVARLIASELETNRGESRDLIEELKRIAKERGYHLEQ